MFVKVSCHKKCRAETLNGGCLSDIALLNFSLHFCTDIQSKTTVIANIRQIAITYHEFGSTPIFATCFTYGLRPMASARANAAVSTLA